MSDTSSKEAAPLRTALVVPDWLTAVVQSFVVVSLPLVLVLVNARALMTDLYLNIEYTRPGFPADPFGFTTEDRLTYAPLALDYLFNNRGIEFLAEQTDSEGNPVYNDRELSHMDDVKNVTASITRYGLTVIAVHVICLIFLYLTSRAKLVRGLLSGSVLTIVLIIAGLILTLTSFDWLFTQFHRLFFVGDTWLFPTSDTLIRLFPTEFWIDAFLLMFGGALVEAVILRAVMRRLAARQVSRPAA